MIKVNDLVRFKSGLSQSTGRIFKVTYSKNHPEDPLYVLIDVKTNRAFPIVLSEKVLNSYFEVIKSLNCKLAKGVAFNV